VDRAVDSLSFCKREEDMTKGKETKKDAKKKPAKTMMEKRAAKRAKKQGKGGTSAS
jgi:hypothetical protein